VIHQSDPGEEGSLKFFKLFNSGDEKRTGFGGDLVVEGGAYRTEWTGEKKKEGEARCRSASDFGIYIADLHNGNKRNCMKRKVTGTPAPSYHGQFVACLTSGKLSNVHISSCSGRRLNQTQRSRPSHLFTVHTSTPPAVGNKFEELPQRAEREKNKRGDLLTKLGVFSNCVEKNRQKVWQPSEAKLLEADAKKNRSKGPEGQDGKLL